SKTAGAAEDKKRKADAEETKTAPKRPKKACDAISTTVGGLDKLYAECSDPGVAECALSRRAQTAEATSATIAAAHDALNAAIEAKQC
ncbi:unnamed protein product, partial [Prorocentrum cordatum]